MKPTRLQLERWAIGDLDEAERRAVEQALAADSALRTKADALAERIAQARVPLRRTEGLARPSGSWRPWIATVAIAAMALLLVGGFASGPQRAFRGGSFDLEMTRVRLGAVQTVGVVVKTRRGDRLQWAIEPERDGYVQVFDVQDDGSVQVWAEARFAKTGQLVEGAVLLDAYPGQERVYFVVGPRPISIDVVREALSRTYHTPLADLDALPGLGRDVVQRSVLLVEDP